LKEKMPHIGAVGDEPLSAQRDIGYGKGLSQIKLVDGDAMRLAFADGSFDLVCAFGVLHHVPRREPGISKMLRVAKKPYLLAIAISPARVGKFSRFLDKNQCLNVMAIKTKERDTHRALTK
jgi:ubiquinone/menaquinone biosynthesis C-methylase UbiE